MSKCIYIWNQQENTLNQFTNGNGLVIHEIGLDI